MECVIAVHAGNISQIPKTSKKDVFNYFVYFNRNSKILSLTSS